VIPNAVDPEAFPLIGAPDPALQSRLGLTDAVTLGFLGSFYAYEGLDTLLDAVPDIVRFEPRLRVLLVGGGFEESRLQEQARRLGIADRVIFAGRVPHAEVSRYYSLVDLLVYPRKSMRLTETVTPLKPLEAMAQGRLLIASDVGGHRELIENGVTGRLFRPDDSAALARTVREVLGARAQWDEIRASGRRFVEQQRNWRASVARYIPVYEALARRAGAAA
jgi:glycosyltransferase involved in cell wall biosynthesis